MDTHTHTHIHTHIHTHFFAKNAGSAAAAITECNGNKESQKARPGPFQKKPKKAKNKCATKLKEGASSGCLLCVPRWWRSPYRKQSLCQPSSRAASLCWERTIQNAQGALRARRIGPRAAQIVSAYESRPLPQPKSLGARAARPGTVPCPRAKAPCLITGGRPRGRAERGRPPGLPMPPSRPPRWSPGRKPPGRCPSPNPKAPSGRCSHCRRHQTWARPRRCRRRRPWWQEGKRHHGAEHPLPSHPRTRGIRRRQPQGSGSRRLVRPPPAPHLRRRGGADHGHERSPLHHPHRG